MMQLHVKTPLLYSNKLSKTLRRPVYLKLENVQPGGSFKIRYPQPLFKQQLRWERGALRHCLLADPSTIRSIFFLRGIGHLCAKAKASGYKNIISSSGGNAGVAAAIAGQLLHMNVRIPHSPVSDLIPLKTVRSEDTCSLVLNYAFMTVDMKMGFPEPNNF